MPSPSVRPLWEVLVVDDDEGIRELIVSYFNGLGMLVTGAQDGRAAIATLHRSNGRFGLVVTDLNLPGAAGFAVLQPARHANPHCYVVIVTGYASLDSAIHAVRVGAYDYLTKPFSMGQLDVVMARITDRMALENQHRERPRLAAVPLRGVVEPPSQFDSIEDRLSRIEATISRLETRLELLAGSPFSRL